MQDGLASTGLIAWRRLVGMRAGAPTNTAHQCPHIAVGNKETGNEDRHSGNRPHQ